MNFLQTSPSMGIKKLPSQKFDNVKSHSAENTTLFFKIIFKLVISKQVLKVLLNFETVHLNFSLIPMVINYV